MNDGRKLATPSGSRSDDQGLTRKRERERET